ncbi:MAG: hypothetical protein AB1295_03425 [Candidatus Micrarchaeota archaeon]
MKLALDKKQGNRIEWIAEGVGTSFANLVRRYALSRIPVLAIDHVTFYDNNTAFWDEYIAHRLGLLPITTPNSLPHTTEIIFSLDAEGPKMAYASDMASSDKEITVAKDKIPIVTLGPNQHLRFEAKAVLGTALSHSKFQAGILSYGEEGKGLRFMVESFFQMEPADVVDRACEAVETDIEFIEAVLLGKEPPKKKEAKAEKPKKAAAKKEAKPKKAATKKKKEAAEEKAEEKEDKKE